MEVHTFIWLLSNFLSIIFCIIVIVFCCFNLAAVICSEIYTLLFCCQSPYYWRISAGVPPPNRTSFFLHFMWFSENWTKRMIFNPPLEDQRPLLQGKFSIQPCIQVSDYVMYSADAYFNFGLRTYLCTLTQPPPLPPPQKLTCWLFWGITLDTKLISMHEAHKALSKVTAKAKAISLQGHCLLYNPVLLTSRHYSVT